MLHSAHDLINEGYLKHKLIQFTFIFFKLIQEFVKVISCFHERLHGLLLCRCIMQLKKKLKNRANSSITHSGSITDAGNAIKRTVSTKS